MLRDLIVWSVPSSEELNHTGTVAWGQSKSVVHKSEMSQDRVFENYFWHSKHVSFQRQLNYLRVWSARARTSMTYQQRTWASSSNPHTLPLPPPLVPTSEIPVCFPAAPIMACE